MVTGHFGDESFQAITWYQRSLTGEENLASALQEYRMYTGQDSSQDRQDELPHCWC